MTMLTMVGKHLLRHARLSVLLISAGFFLAVSPSFAQKTDVNVNIYGAIPGTATAPPQNPGQPSLQQTADPAVGIRVGARHIFSPIFGLEVNYGYSRATQYFSGNSIQTGVVYSHAKPFTVDYVVSAPHKLFGLQPFALAGAGFISYNISSYVATTRPPGVGAIPARPEKIPVFEYGVGADYHPAMLPSFVALRFQFRGLVGHAPDYRLPYLATNNLINVSEPQAGLVFKF